MDLIDWLSFLQLEYFETILNPYFTSGARESLKSLQGLLLEKATESMADFVDNPGHNRRPTRGSEDAVSDDRPQGATVSPDELIVSNFLIQFGILFCYGSLFLLHLTCYIKMVLHFIL